MSRTPHFPVNTLALKRGGLVKAVRERANALADDGTTGPVSIVVLAAQPRLEIDVASLKRGGHLHPDVAAYSILQTLDRSSSDERVPVELPQGPDISVFPVGSKGREFRYFRDGVYVRYARFDAAGRLAVVEHFDQSRFRYRRDEIDEVGSIARSLEYRRGSETPIAQRFFGRDSSCYLTIWQDPGQTSWGTSFVHADESASFATMGGLYRYAFERHLAREESPAIVSEFRENLPNLPAENLDDIIASVRHPNLLKIMTAHSNHLQKPYVRGSGTSPNWTRAGKSLDAWDRVVVLTEAQKEDLAHEFGHEDAMRVIGQVAPTESSQTVETDPHRIVIVARIHPKKRLDEAMRVFAHVVRAQPLARLEIFGFGYKDAEESHLTELIDELGIGESVTFMPFSNNPVEIYGSGLVTLLTSASEGFPLTLLESMSHGVPVAAYDANYGPRDVIEDDTNGILLPFGEHEQMAGRILAIMDDPAKRSQMAQAARATLPRFSSDEFVRRWLDILAAEPTPHRVVGKAIGPVVASAGAGDGDAIRFTCNGPMPAELNLVLTERSTGEVLARGPHEGGAWTLALPRHPAGTLVDAFACRAGESALKRVPFAGLTETTAHGWRIYRTKHGSLSLKSL